MSVIPNNRKINNSVIDNGDGTYRQEISAKNFAVRTDKSGSTEYIGLSQPGTATSAATWQIQRITTSGQNIAIEWADGNDDFDNVWDDRAILSYS